MFRSRTAWSIVALLAVAAAALEVWMTSRAGLNVALAVPLALASAGAVVWIALAADTIGRRATRPTRADMHEAIDLLRAWKAEHAAFDAQIEHFTQAVALLAAAPRLSLAERELDAMAQRVERWEDVARDVARWQAAASDWHALAAPLDPTLAPIPDEADDAALHAARSRLPFSKNLSSPDLKAALLYLVRSEDVAAARRHFGRLHEAVIGQIDARRARPH